MMVLGLTGSVGMGKSTVADVFRAEKIPVYDADESVHDLYGNAAVEPVRHLFPEAVIHGIVDRPTLSRIVLNNAGKMRQLENAIHPMVREKECQFLKKAALDGASFVVLDIPLLFETGGNQRVDRVLLVTASPEEQRRRVLSRDGMTEEKFSAILKRQMPDREKRQKADFIINTDQSINKTREQIKNLVKQIQNRESEKLRG